MFQRAADRLAGTAAARPGARGTRSGTAARRRARAPGRRPCSARAASPSRCRSCRSPDSPRRAGRAITASRSSARPCCSAEADEDAAPRSRALVAVVELGDAALAEHARRTAGNCPARSGISTASSASRSRADVGALGDVAQAVEVHVGAAVDRHQPLVAAAARARRTASWPATASAPAGSGIERVSSKMSWIAAQISSVSTSTISST